MIWLGEVNDHFLCRIQNLQAVFPDVWSLLAYSQVCLSCEAAASLILSMHLLSKIPNKSDKENINIA